MRQSFVAGVCALLVAAPVITEQAAPQKSAYINSQALFQIAPGREEAQKTFEKEQAGFRTKLQQLSDSLQELQSKFNKEEVSLSPTAKEARLKSLRATEADFQDRAQKMNEQQQQRETELMSPILESIKKALEDVRVEGGYTFIFDAAAGNGVLAAFDKNLDITETVVARIKSSAPKVPAKPGPTVAPAGIKRPPSQ